ncbi:MAG TPA: NYN domain-containing protein [Pyrinomonadaceae bacterium]|nr:NYN domain-containing protein [Pyrinomonadaceae bacterium]
MNDQVVKDKFAVLVDGDNAQPSLLEHVLVEVTKYGRITIKRIYGDWTTPNMNGWRKSLLDLAIQPVQQFRYTTGKNATDSTMIIDALDILHRRLVDGFCIVSSDSDFTRLATRIREDGLFVLGIGESKTPNSFVKACDIFAYTENIVVSLPQQQDRSKKSQLIKPVSTNSLDGLAELFKQAFAMSVTNDGWVNLAVFGSTLRRLDSAFDSRTYGYERLSTMLNKKFSNAIEQKRDGKVFPPAIYVRLKSQ